MVKFYVSRGKRGINVNFSIFNQQRAHLLGDFGLFEPSCEKKQSKDLTPRDVPEKSYIYK